MKVLSFDVGIINLAYCIFDTSISKILHWEVINFELSKTNVVDGIYTNLIRELDARKHLLDIDQVIIEKQPSFNPKMRIVAGCLQTYFYIRAVVDLDRKIKVEFFSPKHKLKCYTGPPIIIDSVKSKYSKTKKMGVLITASKLKEYHETENVIELFEKSKKKDDLADCYLQAVTYSIFKKLIKNSTVPNYIEYTPKEMTKAEIKRSVVDYITLTLTSYKNITLPVAMQTGPVAMQTGNAAIINFNNISDSLKKGITSKFELTFPLTTESTNQLIAKMTLKKLTKNILISV